VLQNKPYLVLMVTFGSGIGLFTCLQTLLEQIICPQGYSDVSMNLVLKHIKYISFFRVPSMILDPYQGRKFIIVIVIVIVIIIIIIIIKFIKLLSI